MIVHVLTSLLFNQNLTPDTLKAVEETFAIFDVDSSEAIDKEEAINHWKGAFGKISAKEFFNTVDVNNDGQISKDEFINFWKVVKGAGHTEEEILEELEKIRKGESWCGFDNLPKQYQQHHK